MTTTASTGDVKPGTAYNFNWQSASSGQVMMSTCSYWGDNGAMMSYAIGNAEDCGGICAATPKCNNFAWWGNMCYLKMPGITHRPALSAVISPRFPIGQCGYVVNRKSIGPWTTDGQFKVASNCAFASAGSCTTWFTSDLGICKSKCLEDPLKCNYFKVGNGTCVHMKADPSMNPIPTYSSAFTCGYLSNSVTISPNGPTLAGSVTPVVNPVVSPTTVSPIASPVTNPTSKPNVNPTASPAVTPATASSPGPWTTDGQFQFALNCNFAMPNGGRRTIITQDNMDMTTCKSYSTMQNIDFFTLSNETTCTLFQPNVKRSTTTTFASGSICGRRVA
jgi:hypothetical protein